MPEVMSRAWAQQVLEEHRELRAKKTYLRDFLRQPRPETGKSGAHTWAAELARQLVSLHDELFRHFRFEEEGGMVEEIEVRHPRATTTIERLVGEHPEMLRDLRKLMDAALRYSEGREPEDPLLRHRVAVLLDQLERHEMEENGLIQDLEVQDLGLGD
ncbi:MAG: hypothetical protein GY769_21470 [bacterium]|nr:hypothetical protein [bacterium]